MDVVSKFLVGAGKRDAVTKTPAMNKWISVFREEREFDGIKENTIIGDLTKLGVFLEFAQQRLEKEPDELYKTDFIKFFNYLEKERKISKNTQNRYFNLLKVFYRAFKLDNFMDFRDESNERKRFSSSRIEVKHYDAITEQDLNLVIAKIFENQSSTKIRDLVVIRMLWDTGARVSEVLNLKYEDCDFENGEFRLRNTKSHEERKVVCSSDTLELLKCLASYNFKKEPKDYLFQSTNQENLGKIADRNQITRTFGRAVDKLKEEEKIQQNKRYVVHSLRHGRAVDLLNKGVPIDVVKEILGHRSLETTLYYSHSRQRKEQMLQDIKKLL
ncbi:tyrosine-type recombinase/integrase [Methanococcus maripaludis]|uniref:Probable integrase/recombinase n=1 Tax=Methanococcus maripaludis (strain DSM 14266 / JCM 13030 / NBRC 101832 / S2 / LL) TaxID=267377 RepID=Q6M001_METMP|nr:site-specific integrase [Methanococcus maripaludis]CAF30028.1 Probable integrase/recombinase [Methanococcus maripaludis S2]